MHQSPLAGHRALVTGGSRGIGLAISKELASQGAEVIVAARSRGALRSAETAIDELGPAPAHGRELDITDHAAIGQLFERVECDIGPVDIVVNNAGAFQSGTVLDTTPAQWQQLATTNVSSVLVVCQEAVRRMVTRRSGRIVNVASIAGTRGVPGAAAYAMSKAAVIALTRCLAAEVAATGVTVNAIAPGMFETDMTEQLRDGSTRERWAKSRSPMNRFGTVDELAPMVATLVAPRSSFTTGQVIAIDGGWAATDT